MSKELYVINFIESGEILNHKSFKDFWKNYGDKVGSGLYGWRAPKKVYFTLGQAKSGFSHVPEQLKPLLEISKFVRVESVTGGEELVIKQKEAKEKKKIAAKVKWEKYKLEQAQKQLKAAQEALDKIEREKGN